MREREKGRNMRVETDIKGKWTKRERERERENGREVWEYYMREEKKNI